PDPAITGSGGQRVDLAGNLGEFLLRHRIDAILRGGGGNPEAFELLGNVGAAHEVQHLVAILLVLSARDDLVGADHPGLDRERNPDHGHDQHFRYQIVEPSHRMLLVLFDEGSNPSTGADRHSATYSS